MSKFEVWEQEPTKKTTISEITGLVKTDEPTNSVELKKEAQLNICEKKLIKLTKENEELKSFIKRLANERGEIILLNGYCYNIKKVIGE